MPDLLMHRATLLHLMRTDPNPRVRRRASGLVLIADGQSCAAAARLLHTSPGRLRVWSRRFLAEGRNGLIDRRRGGRPPNLDAAARALVETALTRSPLEDGDPVTTWTVADLTDLLAHRGWVVHPATV